MSAKPPASVDFSHDNGWWNELVYFDARPVRRFELLRVLDRTPGMTPAAARLHLDSAVVFGDSHPPLDAEGRWLTIMGTHVHLDKAGHPDSGSDGGKAWGERLKINAGHAAAAPAPIARGPCV